MSANDNFNKSPNHFMILDAISKGLINVDKIARATKLDNDEVESIVNDLLTQRLIFKGERKGIRFGKKKIELGTTEIGSKLLNTKKQELDQKRRQMQQSYDNGDGTQWQSLYGCKSDVDTYDVILRYYGYDIFYLYDVFYGIRNKSDGKCDNRK